MAQTISRLMIAPIDAVAKNVAATAMSQDVQIRASDRLSSSSEF